MRERQWAQVTVSKQRREHAFCKRRPRLRTSDESRLRTSQLNQSPFRPRAEVSSSRVRQFSEYNGKEASASREACIYKKAHRRRQSSRFVEAYSPPEWMNK